MPTVILLIDPEWVPAHFVQVPCDDCGRLGWASLWAARMRTVDRLCGDCYWFRTVDDVLGLEPGCACEWDAERDDDG